MNTNCDFNTHVECSFHTQCDFDTQKCNCDTHDCDFNTHKSDFYTQSVNYTRRVRLSFTEYDSCTQCDFETPKCDYDTHDCDFNTNKSDFYTHIGILIRMSVVMTLMSVSRTRRRVIYTCSSLISTRCVQFSNEPTKINDRSPKNLDWVLTSDDTTRTSGIFTCECMLIRHAACDIHTH
jgi:hypothetical protein